MAKITKFEIENFKGIQDASLSLGDNGDAPVITLIGLNECGKTTLLEAMAAFNTHDEELNKLYETKPVRDALTQIIPLSKIKNFNGESAVTAWIKLDEADVSAIVRFGKSIDVEIDRASVLKFFSVTQKYKFAASSYDGVENWWDISFKYKTKKARSKFVTAEPLDKGVAGPDVWRMVVRHLRERIPTISYFPTFLVNTPRKIYLRHVDGEHAASQYYRRVLQEVLDTDGEGLTIKAHILDRLQAFHSEDGFDQAEFAKSTEQRSIASVYRRLSVILSREILGTWANIFGRRIGSMRIEVTGGLDPSEDFTPYVTLDVTDGESEYQIHERSLGFRWFFSFLLFTRFKQKTKKPTIFLFDEPAANLHAKAQEQLLSSFKLITSTNNQIIYSTHSHHMIEPDWLSNAYVVENLAIENTSVDDDIFSLDNYTDVKATKYKTFVGKHPNKATYYQPVLDKLQYSPPRIIGAEPYIILEGISDFYAFKIALLDKDLNQSLTLIPGGGAEAGVPVINSMLANGHRFHILLDDDAEGEKAKLFYRDRFGFSSPTILSLGELLPSSKGMSLEKFLGSEFLANVQAHLNMVKQPTKKQIRVVLAEELALNGKHGILGDIAKERVISAIEAIGKIYNKNMS